MSRWPGEILQLCSTTREIVVPIGECPYAPCLKLRFVRCGDEVACATPYATANNKAYVRIPNVFFTRTLAEGVYDLDVLDNECLVGRFRILKPYLLTPLLSLRANSTDCETTAWQTPSCETCETAPVDNCDVCAQFRTTLPQVQLPSYTYV